MKIPVVQLSSGNAEVMGSLAMHELMKCTHWGIKVSAKRIHVNVYCFRRLDWLGNWEDHGAIRPSRKQMGDYWELGCSSILFWLLWAARYVLMDNWTILMTNTWLLKVSYIWLEHPLCFINPFILNIEALKSTSNEIGIHLPGLIVHDSSLLLYTSSFIKKAFHSLFCQTCMVWNDAVLECYG